jgi:Zinc knuckle
MTTTRSAMASVQMGTERVSIQEAFNRLKSIIDQLRNSEGNIKLKLAELGNAVGESGNNMQLVREELTGLKLHEEDYTTAVIQAREAVQAAEQAAVAAEQAAQTSCTAAGAAESAATAAEAAALGAQRGGPGAALKKNYSVISTVPIFHGKHDENVNFYFTKLELAAAIGNWSVEEKYLFAKQQLKGDAFEYAESDPTCIAAHSYQAFKEAMCARYKKKETTRFYREQLLTLKKKEGETVEDFADRIKVINVKTYALGDSAEKNEVILEEADQRGLDSFLNGLVGTLGEKVWLAQPKHFAEAITAAVSVVEVNRRASQEPGAVKKIFAVQKHCYNCNGTGHFRSECRSKPFCYRCRTVGHKADACNAKLEGQTTRPWTQQHQGGPRPSRGRYQGAYRGFRSGGDISGKNDASGKNEKSTQNTPNGREGGRV